MMRIADCPGMLLADAGHLASMILLGTDIFWPGAAWANPLVGGSVPFVYAGATMRIWFLLSQ